MVKEIPVGKELKCYFCGKDCAKDDFCYGCGEFVCEDCDVNDSLMLGGHDPKNHQEKLIMDIGTKVKIKESYPCYKSVRGLVGKIIWANNSEGLFQVEFDHIVQRIHHNFCFAQERDLEIVE